MKELRIKDICDKGSSNLKQRDVEGKNGLYPVYGASGIISHIDTYHQEANYIAIVKDGSGIGRVSFMPAKSSVIGTMQYILPKEGFNINYIGYCLQSLDLSKYKQGAAIPHIYFKDYGERIVKVTEDTKEQQSIVDYLDSAFAKIDAMKANAEKALNEAKALFQASLKEMLEPKEGWEEKKLKEIAQIKIGPFGSLLHKKDYISGGVPLVNPIHMVNGHIAIDNNYTISESKAKELSSYLLKENDIVFARRGEIGRCALVGEKENTYLCGTGSLFVRFNQEVDYGFMLLLFQSKYCKEYLEKQATGATMLNINSAIVGDMPIKFPHTNIQQSIVETLDSLKSKVDRLQENYDKISQECDALKQAILRQVFE